MIGSFEEQRLVGLSNKLFQLIILPTRNCQLRCTYCYEEHENIKIKKSIIDNIIEFIIKRSTNTEKFQISWFGGEPLLSKKTIVYFLKILKEKNINYTSGITTNLVNFNENIFNEFISLKLSHYQVTLDGDKDYHDKKRIFINNKGSFDKIMKNLIMMKNSNHDFYVLIRLHYHGDNFNNLENLIEILKDYFIDDHRFGIYIKKIAGQNINLMKESSLIKNEIDLLSNKLIYYKINPKNNLHEGICYASKANSLIIDVDGKIRKCTYGIDDPINEIGYIDNDGKLIINQEMYKEWISYLVNNDLEGSLCPYVKLKKKYNNQ